MQHSIKTNYFCLFLIFCVLNPQPISGVCKLGIWFTIRDSVSGFVIDVENNQPIYAYYTGATTQLWYFECAAYPGILNIANVYKLGFSLQATQDGNVTLAITNYEEVNQQWFVNSDGTLYNVGTKAYIGGEVGNEISTHMDNTSPILFILQEKI